MSKTDNDMPLNDFSDENIEALAQRFLSEVADIEAEADAEAEAEADAEIEAAAAEFLKMAEDKFGDVDDELPGELYGKASDESAEKAADKYAGEPTDKNAGEATDKHAGEPTDKPVSEQPEELTAGPAAESHEGNKPDSMNGSETSRKPIVVGEYDPDADYADSRAEDYVSDADYVDSGAGEYDPDVVYEEGPAQDTGSEIMPDANALPFTLSVADSDGLAVTVLEKGTRLPARVRMSFSAPYKTPSAVKFRLYMGEALFAKDNILIDYIKLSGIKKYKDGITRIVLNLLAEKNGDITFEILDEGSVNRKKDTIKLDFPVCIKDLENRPAQHSAKDAELRDNYLVIQKARYTSAAAERYIKNHKKEIDKETRGRIKEKMKELKKALKKADANNLTAAQKTSMKNLMREVF